MSQENTNLSAPSRMGNGSPDNAVFQLGDSGFIDWYDSPKILLPTQSTNLRRSVQFKKTRSAEEFSPHQSYLNGSTSDLDSIWCTTLFDESTNLEESEASSSAIYHEEKSKKSDQTTPHRSFASATLLSRKRRRKREIFEKVEMSKESPDVGRISIEEGLAFGKASLAKLRQRLHSEGDADKTRTNVKDTPRRTPLRTGHATLHPSPTISPMSSLDTLKRKGETMLTPSLVRPTQSFATSTPKSASTIVGTSLKRFRTMDYSPSHFTETTKDKILRTQSLNITGDGSDDDSFLDDVFVPFTDPSQFTEMLTHSSNQKT